MFRDRTLLGLNLAVFLIMLGVGMIVPLLPQKIINKGTISGAYFLFWGVGMFFGPALVGKLGQLSGPSAGFYIFSLLLVLEALLLAAGWRKPVSFITI
ncbi:MAG: hypothetical protein WCY82_08210 [Desulfotomaculaceae bacterium]